MGSLLATLLLPHSQEDDAKDQAARSRSLYIGESVVGGSARFERTVADSPLLGIGQRSSAHCVDGDPLDARGVATSRAAVCAAVLIGCVVLAAVPARAREPIGLDPSCHPLRCDVALPNRTQFQTYRTGNSTCDIIMYVWHHHHRQMPRRSG